MIFDGYNTFLFCLKLNCNVISIPYCRKKSQFQYEADPPPAEKMSSMVFGMSAPVGDGSRCGWEQQMYDRNALTIRKGSFSRFGGAIREK